MVTVASSKAKEIEACLSNPDVDLWRLREFALTSGGLLNDSLRKRAWPKLLGVDCTDKSVVPPNLYNFRPNETGIPSVSEQEQVDRDVVRSSWHLLTPQQRKDWKGEKASQIDKILRIQQTNLASLIKIVLHDAAGQLQYFQGFHDIAAIFLTVLSETVNTRPNTNSSSKKHHSKRKPKYICQLGLASSLLHKISNSHLKDAMQSDFSSLTSAIKIVLFPMIQFFDPVLHEHLEKSGIEPYFAIPWVLTWFSHDVRDTETASRLFDAFLAAHSLFPLYMAVAMILHPLNRQEILNTECDFSAIHLALQHLPRKSCAFRWASMNRHRTTDVEEIVDVDDLDEPILKHEKTAQYFPPPVSFQELIDTAISFMRRLPPRKIIPLASQYRKGSLEPYLKAAPQIYLLKNPPSWALAATMPSDFILEQRRAEMEGNNEVFNDENTGLRQRKRRSSKQLQRQSSKLKTEKEKNIMKNRTNASNTSEPRKASELDLRKDNRDVVVASGMGPEASDGKRRKLIIMGGIVVVALSIALALNKISPEEEMPLIDIGKDSCRSSADGTCVNLDLTSDASSQGSKSKKGWLKSGVKALKLMMGPDAENVLL